MAHSLSITDQLDRLRASFPGWVIWYGTHTASWWALPPGPPPGPDGWIEAATSCALETALRSITAAARPAGHRAARGADGRHEGRVEPLAVPAQPVPARPVPRSVLIPAGRSR